MIRLKNPVAQELIDKIIKELKDVNCKRKTPEFVIKELPIPRIIAPLWYYLGDKDRCVFFKDLLDDLKEHPNYYVTLNDSYSLSLDPNPWQLEFETSQFASPKEKRHYYRITLFDNRETFAPRTEDVPRFWDFMVDKITVLARGRWDIFTPETTTGYDYSEFVESLEKELR